MGKRLPLPPLAHRLRPPNVGYRINADGKDTHDVDA